MCWWHAFFKNNSYISNVKFSNYVLYQIATPTKIPKHKNYWKGQKFQTNRDTGCVTLWLAIYILKYLKAKEELMETQMFQHAKI